MFYHMPCVTSPPAHPACSASPGVSPKPRFPLLFLSLPRNPTHNSYLTIGLAISFS